MNRPVHALVLAAGLGTRLAPLTSVRAKPAVPIGGEPIIRRIIRWLVAGHVRHITVNLHHLPATITSLVGDGADLGADVRYSWEQPRILGSAGGPRQALDIIGADTFFLVNGDTLTDAPLDALWQAHCVSGAAVTMAVTPNVDPQRYGGVKMDTSGVVSGFAPKGASASGSFHFVGVQVVSREAFLRLAAGQPANTVGGLYDDMLKEQPGSIRGCSIDSRFWDVGTVADYWRTSAAFSNNSGATGVPLSEETTDIRGSILWNRVSIGDDAALDECIVTDDVAVPAGARYRRQILIRGADGQVVGIPFEVD